MATTQMRIQKLEEILLPPTQEETKIIVQIVGHGKQLIGTIEQVNGEWVHSTLSP